MSKIVWALIMTLVLGACSDSQLSRLKKSHYNKDGSTQYPIASDEDKAYWKNEQDKQSEAWKEGIAYCKTHDGQSEICDELILKPLENEQEAAWWAEHRKEGGL